MPNLYQTVFTEEELPQRSPEWYAWRKGGIGASQIAQILGLQQRWGQTAESLFLEMTGQKERVSQENQDTLRGQLNEDVARKLAETRIAQDLCDVTETSEIVGPKFIPASLCHPDYPYLRASLDGIDFQHRLVLEIKSPRPDKLGTIAYLGELPNYYYPQVQFQLYLASLIFAEDSREEPIRFQPELDARSWSGYFVAYNPAGFKIYIVEESRWDLDYIAIIPVTLDLDFCQALLLVLQAFWNLVVSGHWDHQFPQYVTRSLEKYGYAGKFQRVPTRPGFIRS